MFELLSLTKRNIKVFIKDKTTVFFSLLSAIIMLALYFMFLGNLYVEGFGDLLDGKIVTYLKYSQMLGGVLVINTISLSLGALGGLVSDIESKRIDSILSSPVKRYKVTLGYYFSSITISSIINICLWLIGVVFVGISSSYWYPVETIFQVIGILLLFAFISTSIVLLIATFIKSTNAFGAITGVLGTFIAFISGIYMPYVTLSNVVKNIGSAFPFTHMTIWLKRVILVNPLGIANMPAEGLESLNRGFGIEDVGLFGANVPLPALILIGCGTAVIAFALSVYRMSKKMAQK